MSKKTIKLQCKEVGEVELSYDHALNLLRYQEEMNYEKDAPHFYSLSDDTLDFTDGKIISRTGTGSTEGAEKQESDSEGRKARGKA